MLNLRCNFSRLVAIHAMPDLYFLRLRPPHLGRRRRLQLALSSQPSGCGAPSRFCVSYTFLSVTLLLRFRNCFPSFHSESPFVLRWPT